MPSDHPRRGPAPAGVVTAPWAPRQAPPIRAHGRCRLELGLLSRGAGQPAAARAHLEAAAAMFREMDMPFWLKQAAAASDDLG